jgi:hypothetical protein
MRKIIYLKRKSENRKLSFLDQDYFALTKLSTDTKSTEPKSTYTYDGKKI